MDRLTNRERRNVALGISGCLGLIALTSSAVAHNYLTDTERSFKAKYTSDSECLDMTPYDIDEGASVVIREVNGQRVLTVIPEHTNTYTPAVLNFTHDTQGFKVKFNPADYQTGSLMASDCGFTEGY